MSAGSSNLSDAHLRGGVSISRNINPKIRASTRREDPDANPEPHYTGLAGTTLNISVTPTGAVALPFITDDLDDALGVINAADPANLLGFEEDGYLVLKNLNGGGKNSLEIVSGDAAPILGFVVSPEAGSKSFAGEFATSPPGRYKEQNNPQGTRLIAGDEDLTSEALNRAMAGSVLAVARVARDLDILVPGVQEFAGVVATHAGSGKQVVYIVDAGLRIPVNGYGIAGTTQAARELDAVVHVVSTDGEPIIDISEATERYARVLDVYSEAVGTGSGALDNSTSLVSFGTPDGRSIFGPNIPILNIHSATAIGQVRGDLLVVAGATFLSSGVQPGNTAVIEGATNGDPFNHNGEFIVTEVLTETILAVRPKSGFETTFITAEKPLELNPNLPGGTSYGTVRVVVGDYISAKDGVAFEVPSWVPAATNVIVRCVSGARMRNSGLGDFMRALAPNQGSLLKEFKDHIVDAIAGRRHGAIDVDAPAVAGSPDSLALGTVESQLAELLNHVNTLIAGNVSYGGGIAWADTGADTPAGPTANPGTDLESQVDKMLTDLAGVGIDGAAKVRALAAGDLVAGNIRAQLNQLDTEWSKLNRTESITGLKTFTQLAALDGGATVGAVGIDSSGDVEISSATKQFKTAPSADTLAAVVTATIATDHNLLWEFGVQGSIKGRIYASNTGTDGPGIELVVNAVWGGASWSRDDDGASSARLALSNDVMGVWTQLAGAGTWLENAWINAVDIDMSNFQNNIFGGLSVGGLASIASVLSLGGNLTGSELNAEVPRIDVVRGLVGSVGKTLVMQFGASNGKWRLYASDSTDADEAFELTYNARWNSGTARWNRDNNSLNSANYLFEGSRFKIRHHDAAQADTWLVGSWERQTYEFGIGDGLDSYARWHDGRLIFENNGVISNPATNSSIVNSCLAKNQIKAWGHWDLQDAATPIIRNGFNINTQSMQANGFQVNFGADMVDDNFAVAWAGEVGLSGGIAWKTYDRSTGFVRVYAYNTTGTQLNLGDQEFGGFISMIVVGQQ